MKKIDWYIFKKLIITFFFCLLLFTIVAVAVDTSEKTDDFVRSGLTTSEIITKYYLGFVPFIWSLLFPLFVFIAVIFFTSKMATRSEVIAILASGTSYQRFLRPYMVAGLLLTAVLWVGSRYWIPKANAIRSDFQQNYIDNRDPSKNRDMGNSYYKRIDSNTYIGIRDFDTASKSSRGFFMEKVKDNKVVYNLRADRMRWDIAVKKWQLLNAAERFIDSMGERLLFHDSLIINLSVKPTELRKDYYLKDKLTTPELVAFLKQEELRGTEGLSTFKVERHRRNATPASVFLLTLIGVVIASRKTRGGSGMHMALGITIAALFIIADRFSTVFATKGNFPPMLAAWLPNIAFTFVLLWLYRRTPK
ncbi:MAG: LptF/LptG family permease [Chitinophagaceae bacterium]